MSKYEKEWARKRRNLLFDVLGNRCYLDWTGECKGPLQVDCIVPQGDKHHKMDTSARQSFYHAQLRKDNLRLACEYHNATGGGKEVQKNGKKKYKQKHENPNRVDTPF